MCNKCKTGWEGISLSLTGKEMTDCTVSKSSNNIKMYL